jgi:hypothetical protein
VIPVLRILLKWGYKWNLSRQPCLESLFSLMSMTITFALQKRSLYLAVSWTLSVFIVLITLSSAWWWSHISNVLSVLVKAVHVWVWCGNHWTASTISWSQKFFKLRKNKPASSQSFQLCKTLRQTQDRAKQKTLCLLKKMSNNNNGDEETPQPETLS